MKSGDPEEWPVPVPLVAPVVLLKDKLVQIVVPMAIVVNYYSNMTYILQ